MARMHIPPAERRLVKLQCLRLLVTQQLDPARSHLIMSFVEAYLTLNEDEQREFRLEIERLPQPEREKVMEFTNQWIEEGRREGIQVGIRKASLRLIRQLMVRRSIAITRTQSARLATLSLSRLQALTDTLLDRPDAIDLDAWLAAESP